MQRKRFLSASAYIGLLLSVVVCTGTGWSEEHKQLAQASEPEFVIVKYGSVLVKSPVPGAKVYIDDTYKGSADSIIESVIVGEHVISCRTDDQAVSGTFQVKKNETLRLEAQFDEGKLVVYKEAAKAEKAEVEKKPEPVKHEKPKKTVAEPKKVEQKNPVEERRKLYLTVMKLDFNITDSQSIQLGHAANQKLISKYTETKNRTGKYYRTKQGVLLCDAGPCELDWSASFIYTDESGKADALLLKWKETVFNGITPTGTSKRDLECCLNGQCWKMEDTSAADAEQEFEIGRYRLGWAKKTIVIRRSDIMKEILDAGRSLADY